MNERPGRDDGAMQLLERMFDVEMRFLQSGEKKDVAMLAAVFHSDVVVHEPASLPYAGRWVGLNGLGRLFQTMREVWSDVRVEDLEAARSGDTVLMACTLHLTCRANGAAITQPFAEKLRFKDGLMVEGTPFYHDTSAIVAALARAEPAVGAAGLSSVKA